MQYKGSCHCKNIEFEVETNLEKIVQCNCSICIRRNAKMIMIPKENFILIKGEKDLALYQFNSNIAKHYFCKKSQIFFFCISQNTVFYQYSQNTVFL